MTRNEKSRTRWQVAGLAVVLFHAHLVSGCGQLLGLDDTWSTADTSVQPGERTDGAAGDAAAPSGGSGGYNSAGHSGGSAGYDAGPAGHDVGPAGFGGMIDGGDEPDVSSSDAGGAGGSNGGSAGAYWDAGPSGMGGVPSCSANTLTLSTMCRQCIQTKCTDVCAKCENNHECVSYIWCRTKASEADCTKKHPGGVSDGHAAIDCTQAKCDRECREDAAGCRVSRGTDSEGSPPWLWLALALSAAWIVVRRRSGH